MSSAEVIELSSSDSELDTSVELVYDFAVPKKKFPNKVITNGDAASKSSNNSSKGKPTGASIPLPKPQESSPAASVPGSKTPVPLTHYRCVKFDAHSEIELVIRKWLNRPSSRTGVADQDGASGPPELSPEELDLAETLANLRANLPPLGTVYFALLTGRVESFGIQLVPNRLYTIHFGARFVMQTFQGCELCFLIRNPEASFDIHAKYIEPPAYRPKNLPPGAPTPQHTTTKEMQFVPLASPNGFTAFDPQSGSLNLSALMPLIRFDSRISPTGDVQRQMADSLRIGQGRRGSGGHCASNERWRLAASVKLFGKRPPGGQKPPNWIYQSYVHLAQELNRQRSDAAKANRPGPNVMIVGPCDAGKSTLAKIVANYAVNEHWSPMFVDLDVGQGSIGVPGIIGAGIIDTHCQLDQEYTFRNGYPMMVHFGGITPDSDKAIHVLAVNCLARQIRFAMRSEEEQQALANKASGAQSQSQPQVNAWTKVQSSKAPSDPQASFAKRSQEMRSLSPMTSNAPKQHKRQLTKWSGLVVNTHGWIFDYGYESTLDAIRKLSISTVVVLGDYRLYERMHRDVMGCDPSRGGGGHGKASGTSIWSVTPVSGIKVLFFQRNFSAVKRHSKLRRRMRMDRFARLFEPSLSHPLTTVSIPFAHHPIFRFYSNDSFQRFLHEASEDGQSSGGRQDRNGNWPPISAKNVAPHNYWTCKVEKMNQTQNRGGHQGHGGGGASFDQVVFYHLTRETLVYLMNRVLTVLSISIDQLLAHNANWLSLRQLLAAQGFARVVQVDLEKECLEVELPSPLAPALRNGNLVLLEIETVGPRRSK